MMVIHQMEMAVQALVQKKQDSLAVEDQRHLLTSALIYEVMEN